MNGKVTQEEISKVVWQACDTFRGVIDPSQLQGLHPHDAVLKYVSDVSKRNTRSISALRRRHGRAQRAMRRERFRFRRRVRSTTSSSTATKANIGELIDIALADLGFANREKLSSEDGSGIFRNISFNSSNLGETKGATPGWKQLLIDFSDERLQFDESHLANNDVIGDAYMFTYREVRQRCREEGWRIFTPKEVSTLLAD